uniref:Uncharacterized protein n=1 Tax=Physcomitrium patens TaxID=3218 RepID=A0A2K1KNC2_PHYPA|nr:hypothetical protein PHYPA_006152 [Physcomitrium patens]
MRSPPTNQYNMRLTYKEPRMNGSAHKPWLGHLDQHDVTALFTLQPCTSIPRTSITHSPPTSKAMTPTKNVQAQYLRHT